MLQRFIEKLEEVQLPFLAWITCFLGVVFLRFFFENISSPPPSFPAVPDIITLVHYLLFYVGIFLSLALILGIFSKSVQKSSKFLLFGLPIIWLSPIYDLVTSGGKGRSLAYIFASGQGLFKSFFSVGNIISGGLTPGLRVEIIAIIIGSFLYILLKTKRPIRAILGGLCAYLAVFSWLAFPSIAKAIADFFAASLVSPQDFLLNSFSAAHITQLFLRPTVQVSPAYAIEILFNLGNSHLYYVIDFVLFSLWTFAVNRRIFNAIIKNLRPERVAHYFVMIIAGILVALYGKGTLISSWLDIFAVASLFVAYFSAFMFSVGVNDLADVAIDALSNKNRPLITKQIEASEMKSANTFFFVWALVGAYICGYWTLFLISIYIAAYYIYSAPPLRLKKIPILATFLVSAASIAAAMAGFYFVNAGGTVHSFPPQFFILIIVCLTLGANIKDIKDVAGDRADRVFTIPVIFGEERGREIIGALLAISFLIVPLITVSKILFVPSAFAAILGYAFVVSKKYREWKIFTLYYCYAAVVGVVLWLR